MIEAAPWWGVPVIAGSFLIMGGILGFLFSIIQDHRKHRHDDRIQHREMVREVIVEVLDALSFMKRAIQGTIYSDERRQQIRAELKERLDATLRSVEILKLLMNVSHVWRTADSALHHEYRKSTAYLSFEVVDGLGTRSEDELEAFLKSARKVLGIR